MKRKLPIIAIILLFVTGLGVLSYPLISSVINNIGDRNEASRKISQVKDTESEKSKELFAEADKYNNSLINTVILTDPFDEESYEKIGANYTHTFDTDGNGLIGYLEIPKINVFLPIYHGTDTEVLSKGVGHLNNTSLPVGGENTHSVLSAHSAFPSKTLFDYLPDMETGDVFYVYVLDRTLKYEVDQIKTVLPDDTSDLYVSNGKDYVTLMTCTPYSINTHRLLVRGTRVKNEDKTQSEITPVSTDNGYIYLLGYKLSYVTVIIAIAVFLAAVTVIILLLVKKRGKQNAEQNSAKDGD